MSINKTSDAVTNYAELNNNSRTTDDSEVALSLSTPTTNPANNDDLSVEFDSSSQFQNKTYELAFSGDQIKQRILQSASTPNRTKPETKVPYTVKLSDDATKRYDSREVRNQILREQFGFSDADIAEYDILTNGKGFVVFNEKNPKNKGEDKVWATPKEVKSWENRKTGEIVINVPESQVATLKEFPARLAALKKEASELISKHFIDLIMPLGKQTFGRELAQTSLQRPELTREVFNQLGEQSRSEIGRSMVGALSDDQLVAWAKTASGKDCLQKIEKSLTTDKSLDLSLLAEPSREQVQQRIDAALKTAEAQPGQKRGGARYNAADLKRLYGTDAYSEIDDWVNNVAEGEGDFATSGNVGDGVGLSVGILQWQQQSRRLGGLMQKYKDVAEREGKIAEFYEVFGGQKKAEDLLAKLSSNNPMSVSVATIKPLFAEAGRRDVFKKAQIEAAREETRGYINLVAPLLPYRSSNDTVSARMLAAGLIVKNIGGAPDDPRFVTKAMSRTIDALYDEVARMNPAINEQLQERSAGLKPDDAKRVIATFKRQAVEQNISEKRFLEQLTDVAPRVLYVTKWKYDAYHKGVENRIREAINPINEQKRVNLREL